MLVLDASGSMAEEADGGVSKIEAARESLSTVVKSLPRDQPVGLRVFGAEVFSADDPGACTDSQQVVAPGTDNRDALSGAIDDYEPYGETPTGYALQEAGKDLGGEGQRTILLVSDGEPTCDPDPCEVAADLSQDGIDLRIDVVGLDVSGKAREALQCVAAKGNGTYYDADDAESLTQTLTKTSVRASRPFDLTGEEIRGSTTPAEAPLLSTGGSYLDRVPATGELWYRIDRTAPGSTIHIGGAFRYVSSNNNVYLRLYDEPGGRRCGDSQVTRMLSFNNPLVHGATSTWQDDPDDPCNTVTSVYASVESSSADIAGRPLQFVVYEEPPLADPSQRDLPAQPEPPEWSSLEPSADAISAVVPGTSLASAPVVAEGTYSLDINGGEVQVLAVPLDWGQDLQAQLDCTWPEEGDDVEISMISPLHGAGDVDFFADEPDDWFTGPLPNASGGERVRTGAQTLQTAFRHRSGDARALGAAVPGLRYVQVAFSGDSDEAANLAYTLTLRTNGTAGDGTPEYQPVAGLPAPGPDFAIAAGTSGGSGSEPATTPSPQPSSSSSPVPPGQQPTPPGQQPTPPEQTSDDPGTLPVRSLALGGGGLVLLAAAVVLLVVRLRR